MRDHESQRSVLDFPLVRIGILTALDEEYAACTRIFDPDSTGVELERRATSGTLTCRICSIPANHGGNHIVAITRTPAMGNTASAIAANILMQHCPRIDAVIMCGIAGAVPHPTKQEHHVRLGDIVVSNAQGIVGYDFGKQRDPGRIAHDPFAGFEFRGAPRPPCSNLLAAVGRIRSEELLLNRKASREWEKKNRRVLAEYGRRSRMETPDSEEGQAY